MRGAEFVVSIASAAEESPCRLCKKRFVGCHAQCDGYARYRAAVDKNRREVYKQKAVSDVMGSYVREQTEKNRRREGR